MTVLITVEETNSFLPVSVIINNPVANIFGQKEKMKESKQQICISDDLFRIKSYMEL